MAIPGREVAIDRLSLVVQNGPEHLWDWRVAGTARPGGHNGPDCMPNGTWNRN